MATENDSIFDLWSSGTRLSDSYFQEIDETPAPLTEVPPTDPAVPPEGENEPVVQKFEDGGSLQIEKTDKGWKATLDSGEEGAAPENFYGKTQKELLAAMAKGKLNASKAIHRLKKKQLLGDDETPPPAMPPPVPPKEPVAKPLSADETFAIKNKMAENPAEGFDEYLKARFGLTSEEFADKLKSADQAKTLLEMQRTQQQVEDVNKDFIAQNPDYVQQYQSPENLRLLVQRMSKLYLRKPLPKTGVLDDVIYDLYRNGNWTAENLEAAKDELIEGGLLKKVSAPAPAPVTPPEPVTPPASRPPEIPTPIAERTAVEVPVPFGMSSRNSVAPPESNNEPTGKSLYELPMEQLRQVALAELRQGRG